MIKFTLQHAIECDEPAYWKLFFEPQYNEIFYSQELGFPEFRLIRHDEDEQQIRRSIKVRPKQRVPAIVAKLLGPRFHYVEDSVFDKAERVWSWKTTPSVLAGRLHHEGSMRVDPLAPGRVLRVVEILIDAHVFGLGRIIESAAEAQFRQAWTDGAQFTNRWIKEHCS